MRCSVALPGATLLFVSPEPGTKRTDQNLGLVADTSLADAAHPDIVVVPGGPGETAVSQDERVLDWLRTAHETTAWTTSVCTGSLILGAAGLLDGKRATSHWLALDQLRKYGAEPTLERVVSKGKIITAAGVSAGIDMGLTLAARARGRRGCADDPARHRVRPATAVRCRIADEGASVQRRLPS